MSPRKPAAKAAKKPSKKAAAKKAPAKKPPSKKAAARKAAGSAKAARRKAPDPVAEELLKANLRFYRALTDGDLAEMTALWDHGDDVMCVHPSGLILREWSDIEDSWKSIFEGKPPRVIPESEQVSVRDETGCVFCIERIISEAGMGLAGATNVFRKDAAGTWRMIWHHSALLPSMM